MLPVKHRRHINIYALAASSMGLLFRIADVSSGTGRNRSKDAVAQD
jgi:hypothetical protein